MTIVPLYAALFGLAFVFVSVRTLRLRRRLAIPIGDGGNPQMLRAIRVHANFAEYVPLALILLLLVEQQGFSAPFVHGLGLTLLAGRFVHAVGVSRLQEDYRFRVSGMALTFTGILLAALALLAGYVV